MIINHNMLAVNTHRQMGATGVNQSKSMEKLSSGLRINRAGDDAAGLAISEKMRGQIRGLNQASRNAQDGISLVQTAEGALNETQNILQRMRELAVQSANDTNVTADRSAIQSEIAQLNSEIDRISTTTEFNTQTLLNGSLGAVGSSDATGNVDVVSLSGMKVGTHTVTVDTAATKATLTGLGNATDGALAGGEDITVNGVTIDTTGVTTVAALVTAINDKSAETGFTVTGSDGAVLDFTATEFGSGKTLSIGGTDATDTGVGAAVLGDGVDAVVSISNGTQTNQVTGNGQTVNFKGAQFTVAGAAASTADITISSSGANIHIGANTDQVMSVDINEISTLTLGNNTDKIKDVSVTTATAAETAITTLNDAITQVSSERSKLGAFQNRLEHTIANLDTSSENLQASESRIRDVDMAKEMMEFTKNNILQQAAQSMLAQANQAPQGVLQLLR